MTNKSLTIKNLIPAFAWYDLSLNFLKQLLAPHPPSGCRKERMRRRHACRCSAPFLQPCSRESHLGNAASHYGTERLSSMNTVRMTPYIHAQWSFPKGFKILLTINTNHHHLEPWKPIRLGFARMSFGMYVNDDDKVTDSSASS